MESLKYHKHEVHVHYMMSSSHKKANILDTRPSDRTAFPGLHQCAVHGMSAGQRASPLPGNPIRHLRAAAPNPASINPAARWNKTAVSSGHAASWRAADGRTPHRRTGAYVPRAEVVRWRGGWWCGGAPEGGVWSAAERLSSLRYTVLSVWGKAGMNVHTV